MNPGLSVVARVESPFRTKFGIPRQSGLAEKTISKIVFEPEYAVAEAFVGLDGFSHIWVIWGFSEAPRDRWSPTVRPPRLGGNKRLGVFATRSTVRPNPLALSCARLLGVDHEGGGVSLTVSGLDCLDGTPVYDIKPYVPYADSLPDALGGFADGAPERKPVVYDCPTDAADERTLAALTEVLSYDPRPAYHADGRSYAFEYDTVRAVFTVSDGVVRVTQLDHNP